MIVDSFEIDGEEVDIHIIDNEADNYFSIVSRNQNNDAFNGFEFRVRKMGTLTVNSFAQSAPAFAIVSFMRRQIEEKHWEIYKEEERSVISSQSVNDKSARVAGRKAFLNKQHYRENPYSGLDVFTHDEWDQGWAEEAQKNPDWFDFISDSFRH